MGKIKKSHGLLIAATILFGCALPAVSLGAPPHGVKYTPHNLSNTNLMGAALRKYQDMGDAAWTTKGEFWSTNELEICIFCHTPHNAVSDRRFLWNRKNEGATTFMLYTASPTLNFSKVNAATLSPISRMCMTCHDGVTAVNSMANPRSVTMQISGPGGDQLGDIYNGDPLSTACPAFYDPGPNPPDTEVTVPSWCVNIGEGLLQGDQTTPVSGTGGNLVNDHPVSFIYSESSSKDTSIKTESCSGNSCNIGGLPLWYDNGGYRVECVTCHDPHINYNPMRGGDRNLLPFLRKSNRSSSLCFTCHDK